jgi:hypothetical protein
VRRLVALTGLVVSAGVTQFSCGDSESSSETTTGSSGASGGAAGSAGSGGSIGFDAGFGGTGGSGLAGSGGTGATSGGAAGQGGSGGLGGTGGSSGAGGSGGSSATGGSGGSSATGGSGGTSGGAGGTGGTGGGVGTGGSGGAPCSATQLDCNNDPSDGCESDTTTDPAHCNTCNNVCPGAANATPFCAGGQCGIACDPTHLNCNGDAADGCEVTQATDPSHCNACDNACVTGPRATPRCFGGLCSIICDAGFGDCNSSAADGCEINHKTDAAHCGTCNNACQGASCIDGACECAATSTTAQKLPLDMYIMLDQSGSMNDPVQPSGNKWQAVTSAINSFVTDPASAGIGVGIQYFPLTTPPCPGSCGAACTACGGTCLIFACVGFGGGTSCNIADYATPEVGIAVLPGNAAAISNSMSAHTWGGQTPTGAALQGAISYTKSWAASHPTHVVVNVLATDGDPTECPPTDIPTIAGYAANACNSSPKVLTFVIGVGTSTANLNSIAQGGCTNNAYIVDTGANAVQQFKAALQAIQGQALGCEYLIPQPASGTPDYNKVNVKYTPSSGPAVILPKVTDLNACDPTNGGWYYDNNGAPTKIILCPASCDVVRPDTAGKVDILLGCASET